MKKCSCPSGGPCVTITFADVSIGEPDGAYYWLICGILNRAFTVVVDLGDVGDVGDGSGFDISTASFHKTFFLGISVDGAGTFGFSGPSFSGPWQALGIYLSIYRDDSGDWQIVLWIPLDYTGGLHFSAIIFRGTAPYHADGSATTASNDSAGWTGSPISPPDIESGVDMGSGGTATLAFNQPCPPVTDDPLCLCDGVIRITDCIDLVILRVIDGATTTYTTMIAWAIDASHTIDSSGDLPVFGDYIFRVDLGSGNTFTKVRSDCCSVAGSYTAEAGGTQTVDVLLAADVEVANLVIHPTAGDETFALTREEPPTLGEFRGTSGGGYTCRVYLTTSPSPLWHVEIKSSGTTVLTAQQSSWTAGGSSFASAYTVQTSSLTGIAVSSTITVTT